KSVDVQLQLASLELKRRKFAGAEAAFKKILESTPNEWRAVAGLVETDLAQQRLDRAFIRLEQELKRSHGAPQVRYMLAATALRIGKYNIAIENLRQVAVESPSSIDAQ